MSNAATNECKDSLTEKLYQLAYEFREGIERCDKRHFPKRASDFPRGVCGHVARLVGTFLEDMGLGKSIHVSGIRFDESWYGDHTHAWLEFQGIIVDITASQFEAVTEPVIVTRHSAWHDLYTIYQRQEGTYRSTDFKDIRMVYLLDTIYWTIIRAINPNHELLERREQLTVQKTLTPHIDGWMRLAQ